MAAKKPKKPAAKPKQKPAGTLETRADKVLAAIAPEWPSLTNAQRAAFAARYVDAKCEEQGGRTKSEGVLSEAIGWAPVMGKALKAHPDALRRYSPERFAWYLACARALADARAVQEAKGDTAAARRAQVAKAEKTALDARRELLETLEELVDGDDAEEKALAVAAGTTEGSDRIVASITALATLARAWLGRTEPHAKELVKAAGLHLAEVEAAEAAGEALAAASADKTMEGRVNPRDTPPVNRAEGRMLLEMKAAMRVFARANERNKDVPKLVPGEATRHVLAPRQAKSKANETAPAVPAPASP
jgi:hypothetical protein